LKLSVVIPVYNVAPYLERCVNSVLRQSFRDYEMILVDDGSTDGSGVLADRLAAQDARILVLHQENQGLSGARNSGLRAASGEYVVFLDSDDEWLLEDGLESLMRCDGADLILFKAVHVWENRRQAGPDYDTDVLAALPDAGAVFDHLIRTQQFNMSACMLLVRRALLVENGILFPLGYISEDVPWSLRLWQCAGSVSVLNLDFYAYHHRSDSLSTTPSLRVYDSYDKVFTEWKENCSRSCVNAAPIRVYLAEMWVSLAYHLYLLDKADREAALSVLRRHRDLLEGAGTPKARRAAGLLRWFGLRATVGLLGLYWRLRKFIKG